MGEVAPPKVERMGVAAAELAFSSWGWAFRGQDVEDYGIDAHVEPFDGPDRPSAHLLALQIKAGPSYLREPADGGWWYRGTNKHLRYWLGHVLPVLVVIYDPASGNLYWQHVTEDLVEYTDEAWKIFIPGSQMLQQDTAAEQLRVIAASARGASEDPLANSLALLPPSAAAVLHQTKAVEPDGTMRVARWLAEGREQPRLTAATATR